MGVAAVMRLAGVDRIGSGGLRRRLAPLPVLTLTVGVRVAVPILTVAQLMGNLSRAGFGWRDIHWRPALIFAAGAIPASVIGSRLFIDLSDSLLPRLIGVLLFAVIVMRRTRFARSGGRPKDCLLPPEQASAFCRASPEARGRSARRCSSAYVCLFKRMWRAKPSPPS